VLISVFGGISIYLQNPLYIKWKTTILEWVFALVFIGSQYIGDKSIVERMMGNVMDAPKAIWKRLNFAWAGFFTLVGFVNLYVIYNFDTEAWVDFKTFGVLGMTIVFIVLQGVFMAKYVIQDDDEEKLKRTINNALCDHQ
jgi:intracellular septation protein